jgi:hypothetical protein
MTEGPNFLLVGGSKDTHEVMTEKVIKINEKLAAAGKTLENVSREQMDDIAGSLGLRPEKLPVNGKHLPLGKPHQHPNQNPPENGYC